MTTTRPNTDDALKIFLPGQTLMFKTLDGREAIFTAVRLFTPVTKCVVVLAKMDTKLVVIKIYDPRFFDERFPKVKHQRPWKLAYEQAAATARPRNLKFSDDDLYDMVYYKNPRELSGEELTAYYVFWEERYHRILMDSYQRELNAYERLKDLQGSAIPRLITHGQFIPPDERAIQPSAIVLEYIPSASLKNVSFTSTPIPPAVGESLIAAVEEFHSRGVIHNDIHLTNILFTPPEQPTRLVLIDFGCCNLREDEGYKDDEDEWEIVGRLEAKWMRKLLENPEKYKSLRSLY